MGFWWETLSPGLEGISRSRGGTGSLAPPPGQVADEASSVIPSLSSSWLCPARPVGGHSRHSPEAPPPCLTQAFPPERRMEGAPWLSALVSQSPFSQAAPCGPGGRGITGAQTSQMPSDRAASIRKVIYFWGDGYFSEKTESSRRLLATLEQEWKSPQEFSDGSGEKPTQRATLLCPYQPRYRLRSPSRWKAGALSAAGGGRPPPRAPAPGRCVLRR